MILDFLIIDGVDIRDVDSDEAISRCINPYLTALASLARNVDGAELRFAVAGHDPPHARNRGGRPETSRLPPASLVLRAVRQPDSRCSRGT